MNPNRRNFLSLSAAGLASLAMPMRAAASKPSSAHKAHVVVVGAGFGGATCAKFIRTWDPAIKVTLIEPNEKFISCPMSNWVIGGIRKYDELIKSYANLPKKHGINLVHDTVVGVNPDKRTVTTQKGKTFQYDRLVLAPGVDFMTENIEGYDQAEAAGKVTHAFKAGAQTQLLRKQLEAMPDGGVFVIASPPPPGRCVSGPYERACMAAHYFKTHKPKSKIIMLDGHFDVVSKGPMFKAAWKKFYPGMIEHRPNNLAMKVDAKTMTVTTEFEDVKGDVLNVVPVMRAARLCDTVGVRTDSNNRWCPVDAVTFESTSIANIHVIGDSVLSNIPKSGHVSNNQGKICAAAIVELLNGRQPEPVPIINSTSYSATSDSTAGPIAVVMRYDAAQKTYVRQPGGGASPESDEINFAYNLAWFDNIWLDTLG